MSFPVTTWLIVELSVLFLILTARVIQHRIRCKVSLGDGEDPGLRSAIRAQGNLVESAPSFVLLILVAELQGAAVWLIGGGGLAAAFFLGRAITAYALAFCAIEHAASLRRHAPDHVADDRRDHCRSGDRARLKRGVAPGERRSIVWFRSYFG
ncbi:MAPEG family protein [Breoghania sp.]|uniref:MAPEG family protein n=1 Tax=Breoghania sp. TaxID=2065378 RepID=UPI00261B773D|nr:MAPEG family protein [Breoghania sp.]MDJ0930457.1 MAPEG family protein [Breoghania sp.]